MYVRGIYQCNQMFIFPSVDDSASSYHTIHTKRPWAIFPRAALMVITHATARAYILHSLLLLIRFSI